MVNEHILSILQVNNSMHIDKYIIGMLVVCVVDDETYPDIILIYCFVIRI